MTRYVRYEKGGQAAYGIMEENSVHEISGDVFGEWKKSGAVHSLDSIKVLPPTEPSKVIAIAGNYKSHLGDRPVPDHPEPFFKVPSCLIAHGEDVVIPKGTSEVHPEAEVVIVIGKRAKNVSEEDALGHVLGITCGDDISARDWQREDRQWWRAKGSDTFGPCGPFIVSGIDYQNIDMTLRVNGEVRQRQGTEDMIHTIPQLVSFISQHVTLLPGDLIYTGTPGQTQSIYPGDVVEVELEGVGILKNKVVAAR